MSKALSLPADVDLTAEVPPKLGPFGFCGTALTEGVWLPAKGKEGPEYRPYVVAVMKEGNETKFEVVDWLKTDRIGKYRTVGLFPSLDTTTILMDKRTIEMLQEGAVVNPREVDQAIEAAVKVHHAIKDPAVLVLIKRLIEGTYFYDVFDHFPLVFIYGVSESGKTRLLKVILFASYHGYLMTDPTEASIYRIKEEERCSMFIDEAEQFANPKHPAYHMLMTLLNASYSKYVSVPRYDSDGQGKKVRRNFNLYGPLFLDSTRQIGGITLSRAVESSLER